MLYNWIHSDANYPGLMPTCSLSLGPTRLPPTSHVKPKSQLVHWHLYISDQLVINGRFPRSPSWIHNLIECLTELRETLLLVYYTWCYKRYKWTTWWEGIQSELQKGLSARAFVPMEFGVSYPPDTWSCWPTWKLSKLSHLGLLQRLHRRGTVH